MFDPKKIQKDFPHLSRKINGKRIVYLDSTATSLKPKAVLDAMDKYNTFYTANVFRGIYTTSEEATEGFENARGLVAKFIGAADRREIVFTRNTTESINLVASTWGQEHIGWKDAIVVSIMEHHSNFVPWQQLVNKKGASLKVWNVDKSYELNLADLDTLITRGTKLLAITASSNVLGTIPPIAAIVKKVKRINPKCFVLVDAAQAAAHMPINVNEWGADFVVFSAHKMTGPTGVGVLWARYDTLVAMKPYQYGGEMIEEVHVDRTLFKAPPHKFEAGTPDISGVIGLGAAVSYLSQISMRSVRAHEVKLTRYALATLGRLPYIHIVGPKDPAVRAGVLSFTMDGVHPHDIAQLLNDENVYIRAGHHCAMPLHDYLQLPATARASFYLYTTEKDIDQLVQGLKNIYKRFTK